MINVPERREPRIGHRGSGVKGRSDRPWPPPGRRAPTTSRDRGLVKKALLYLVGGIPYPLAAPTPSRGFVVIGAPKEREVLQPEALVVGQLLPPLDSPAKLPVFSQ